MKILQINTVYKHGSTGNIAYNIHNLLKQKGYKSYVVYGRGDVFEDKDVYKISNKVDFYIHALGTRLLDRHGLFSIKPTKYLTSLIEKIKPDIIQLHNIHGYYLNYKILFDYLSKTDIKVVWTLHDCWAFTGHCSYYDFVECDKWQDVCRNCPQLNQYPKSWFVDNSYNNFLLKKEYFTKLQNMHLITPSNWLAQEVKKSFLSKYPITVIHNGIDLNIFKKIESNFLRNKFNLKDKFLILGVANVWEERKGFNYFIKLSKKLKTDEVIVLVGLNEKHIKALPKNIIGIKRTNNLEELVKIYNESDVFINFTLEDNFPTTNIEALACGLPVITFDSGGASEMLDDNCGFIVKKGDLESVYDKILRVKKVGKSYFIDSCIKRAKLFDKNNKFLEYIKLYEELLWN